MPLHDWQPASDAVFHSFHVGWLWNLARELNRRLLPPGYVARAEESLGLYAADVLVLETGEPPGPTGSPVAIPTADLRPPLPLAPARVAEPRARRIAVFSARDERRVAVIEILSRGNRDSRARIAACREKLAAYLENRLHVTVIDVWPDSEIVGFVARDLGGLDRTPPIPTRSTASFECELDHPVIRVHLRALTLGVPLPDAPLFLAPGHAVMLPLEATYATTFEDLPQSDRRRLEASA